MLDCNGPDNEVSFCEWCASDRHSSDECPSRNLLKLLNDEPVAGKLPDLVVTCDMDELVKTVEEAHAIQHVKKAKPC